MNAHVYIPENELRDSIDCIWYHTEEAFNYRSVSIPFLHPEMIFNLGDSFCVEAGRGSYHYTAAGALSGIYTKPVTTTVRGRYEALGIIFKPEGPYRLFGLPAWQFGMPVPVPGVMEMDGVLDELLDKTGPEEKIRSLERYLLRMARPEKMESVVEDFLEETCTEPLKKGRIQKYLQDRGLTPKSFLKVFRDTVGHTPQTYLQLVQINKAIHQIISHPDHSLTEVAYEQGFYDQAHFIRVFEKFAGVTPSRYKKLALAGHAHSSFPNTILAEGSDNPLL